MKESSAKIIEDSYSTKHHGRVTTFEVTFHRFVLAEFNTHRLFARNSASSRAVPVQKKLDEVKNNPAIPVSWGKNQKGMQAGEELSGPEAEKAELAWIRGAEKAIETAQELMDLGVHKQIANRVLEPFSWHTVIVTATSYENFFNQRCSPLAQPEIEVPARLMKELYESNKPKPLKLGEWHTPYISEEEREELDEETKNKVSVARCARVSYLTHDGKRDIDADLELFERLVSAEPPHWSPLEHILSPKVSNSKDLWSPFTGWRSLRQMAEEASGWNFKL